MLLNSAVFALGIVFIWLVVLSFLFSWLFHHYQRLTAGVTKQDLKTILEKLLKEQKVSQEEREKLKEALEKIRLDGDFHFQKVGLVRFNPFQETGGNQSFALALIDAHDSGIVISSLHGREQTRLYAKPIKEGKPFGFDLSQEEQEAINKAKKGK